MVMVFLYCTFSLPVSFPCGKKQSEVSLHRSLLDESEALTLRNSDGNLNISMEGEGNSTSTLSGINSTQPGGNSTEYMEGVNDDNRIVGGQLERQGGSPWQVGLQHTGLRGGKQGRVQ